MRLTSLLGRGTEVQIENLDIQEQQITNLPERVCVIINLSHLIIYN